MARRTYIADLGLATNQFHFELCALPTANLCSRSLPRAPHDAHQTLIEMTSQVRINAKEHPIVGVTVYQTDRAVIQRRFSVELKVCWL